ncbi:MAG: DUF559 domain-containing protein [Gammaproteobacteria bacterium]
MDGYKFRRQQVLGHYIVDLVCLERKLIIKSLADLWPTI